MLIDALISFDTITEDVIVMLIFGIIAFFVSLALHEFAHALAAYKMGDPTPKVQGRVTLNPLRHIDLFGFICFLCFGFGWAKPVQFNPLNLKKYRTGMRIVYIAGVLMNVFIGLVAAIIYAILLATVGTSSAAITYVYWLLEMFMIVNSSLAIFNFLPIMPLDGFYFISTFFRKENSYTKFNLKYGMILLIVFLIFNSMLENYIGFSFLTLLYDFVFTPIKFIGVLL